MSNLEAIRKIIKEELRAIAVPKLYNNNRAAELLDVNPGTMANWRMDGRGPRVTMVGGAVRYQLTEINRWLQENTLGAA